MYYNLEAEKNFLWSILFDPSKAWDYITTPVSWFQSERNQKIWWAIVELTKDNRKADIANICTVLDQKIMDLPIHVHDMMWGIFSLQDIDLHYEEIKNNAFRRSADRIGQKIRILCKEWYNKQKIISLIDEFYKEDKTDDTKSMLDVVSDIVENRDQREADKIPTGYTKLDEVYNWWFSKGQLICVWARPWMWKTSFMLNLASNQADLWHQVAFLSLEMNNTEMAQRYISLKTQKSYALVDNRDQRVLDVVDKATTTNITLLKPTKAIDELYATIKKLQNTKWLDIVYIDYLQLMVNRKSNQIVDQAIWLITWTLKRIALDENIVIVIGSQMNRTTDKWTFNKRPELNQLRESWNIEQDCDSVMLLFRDKYYDRDEASDDIEVDVAKNRNGRMWMTKLWFKAETMTLYNL